MTFDPWSYKDQLTKQLGKEKAVKIMRSYGWSIPKERKPVMGITERVCRMCGEVFQTSNKRLYCVENSEGQRCSYLNRVHSVYERRKRFYA